MPDKPIMIQLGVRGASQVTTTMQRVEKHVLNVGSAVRSLAAGVTGRVCGVCEERD